MQMMNDDNIPGTHPARSACLA